MTIEMDEEASEVEVKAEERRLGLLVCDCVRVRACCGHDAYVTFKSPEANSAVIEDSDSDPE